MKKHREQTKEIERLEDELDDALTLHMHTQEELREARHVHENETMKLTRELREARDHGVQLERELEAARRDVFLLEGTVEFFRDAHRNACAGLEALRIEDCHRRGVSELDVEEDPDALLDVLREQEEAAARAG